MTGHQQPIIMVSYSPDGRYIASASFDHHVKIWDGKTGKFVASLFGHLRRVYQVAWSADSRMLVSGSSDSTLKGIFKFLSNFNSHRTTVPYSSYYYCSMEHGEKGES